MYIHKKSMGLGLIRLKTIIAKNKIKLYIGHARLESETYNAMCILIETLQFFTGLLQNVNAIPTTKRYWKMKWIDDVSNQIHMRGLKVDTHIWNFKKLSKNATIMDL